MPAAKHPEIHLRKGKKLNNAICKKGLHVSRLLSRLLQISDENTTPGTNNGQYRLSMEEFYHIQSHTLEEWLKVDLRCFDESNSHLVDPC